MFDMFTPGDYIKMLSLACLYICTRGKLSREKTFEGENFREFRCFVGIYPRKFSLQNLGAWRPLVQQNEQSATKVCVSGYVVCTRWTNRHL